MFEASGSAGLWKGVVTEMVKSDKIKKAVYPVVNTAIRIFLLLITGGLCLQSLFSTSFVGRIVKEDGSLQERTLNIADYPWKHLLVFLLFTALGLLLYRGYGMLERYVHSKAAGNRALRVCSGIVLLMGTVWILATQLAPGSDPAKVYSIAMQWRQGNFSSYAEGGYLFRYPFQSGIILFYYFLSFIFGMGNYIGLQFVNLAALVAVYVLLAKLAGLFWKRDRKLPVIVYAALILWVPLAFYITYLYGILPGMALSLGAVYCAARYLDTGKYRYILPACVCMGLATVIKMNCLIYLIAIACFLLYDALDAALFIRQGSGKRVTVSLLTIVLMGLSVAGCNKASEQYVEQLSGYEAGDGEAMISWVVMGLQETPLGPGGYSGYISDVFLRYEYDTDKITEASIADIKKIMKRMSKNILDDGISFFARKNAFQWNDPTFISLDRTKGRTPAADVPDFAVSLIEGKGGVALSVALNYMQTLLLAGMLLCLLFGWHSRNLYELMGAVVFLGGYLFHFVWESSASYTIPYFVIMIPYAAKGLADWIRYLSGLPAAVRAYQGGWPGIRGIVRSNRLPAGCGIIFMLLLVLFARTNLFASTIALNDGEEARAQFYHEDEDGGTTGYIESIKTRARMAGIRDGYYYLSPYTDQSKAVAEKEEKVTVVSIVEGPSAPEGISGEAEQAVLPVSAVRDIEHKILLNMEKASGSEAAGISMRFRSNGQVLGIETGELSACLTVYMDDGMNLFYESGKDISYRWKFRRADEEGYYITINDMALTYRDGELTVEELNKSEEQRWVLLQ